MEIVKELNLNGNPQITKNGSLTFAKNIRLSLDGSFITNDEGFKIGVITSYSGIPNLKVVGVSAPLTVQEIEGNIVGYINCPNEIVILTSLSRIYRLVECENYDELCVVPVDTAWDYSFGTSIVGTYIYNVNNELIISIGESGASVDVPLYTINLNKSSVFDNIDDYSVGPTIPIANMFLIDKVNGTNIPNGLYYFFIRYKSRNGYTNWFPIGNSHYALSLEDKTIINHFYNWHQEDTQYISNKTKCTSYINRNDLDSRYNFKFKLSINDRYTYERFQIGYILQTSNAIVAREWKEFVINDSDTDYTFIFNAFNSKEISIDELIKTSFNIYNVKAITSFENRLYVANIKETNNNIDLESYVNDIVAYQILKPVSLDTFRPISYRTYAVGITTSSTTHNYIFDLASNNNKIRLRNVDSAFITDLQSILIGAPSNVDFFTLFGSNIAIEFIKSTRPSATHPLYIHFVDLKNGDSENYNASSNTYTYSIRQGRSTYSITIDASKYTLAQQGSSSTTQTIDKNLDRTIKSLMPNEVYSFYIHYVRKDGTYTNGYKLSNNVYNNVDYYTNVPYTFAVNLTINEYKNLDSSYNNFKDYIETNHPGFIDLLDIPALQEVKLCEILFEDNNRFKDLSNRLPFDLYINSNGDYLFKTTGSIETNDNTTILHQIGVQFNNIEIPNGFVGYFISYEQVERTSTYQCVQDDTNLYKALEVEDALIGHNGSILIPQYFVSKLDGTIKELSIYNSEVTNVPSIEKLLVKINMSNAILSNTSTYVNNVLVNREYLHGGIYFDLYNSIGVHNANDYYLVCNVIRLNNDIYISNTKSLISLSQVSTNSIYGEQQNSDINYDFNYPSFVTEEKYLRYNVKTEIDETGEVYTYSGINSERKKYEYDSYASVVDLFKFSNFNILAESIKKDSEHLITLRSPGGSIADTEVYNLVVYPVNASDLLELKSDYLYNIYKAYSNYDETLNYENVTPNMIRSSYPIRTESNENSWRIFDADVYYLIDKKCGEITNIFAIGKYFFIHTRNTLLIASSDAKLTADNTTISVTNHKLFDVTPSELFTSDLGFGGLKYRECQILSQHGYIWYDSDHHKIFRYDNSKLEDLTAAVEEFISTYEPTHCYFNIDTRTNRIFMCFMKSGYSGGFTFAYSTLTDKFISFMDFGFDKNLHTTNKVFFSRSGIASIYKYDNTNFGLYDMLGPLDTNLQPVSESEAVFDILINVGPEIPKTLESIRWIHNYLDVNNIDNNNYAELLPAYPISKHTDRKYPEDKIYDLANVYIRIFNNNVDTEELSLFNDKLNRASIKGQGGSNYDDSYKYPHYEKGVWQFNYFRDVINKINDTYYSADGRDKSDIKSLIYGTYFVIRFIFKNSSNGGTTYNKRLKFDTISFKINNY